VSRYRFGIASPPGDGALARGPVAGRVWRTLPSVRTTTALVLAAALVTWIVTIARMRGMDAGPGTDLGGLAWFVGVWVTMMAAMMLPAALPMIVAFSRVSGGRARSGRADVVPTWVFLAGYLATWTAYGLAAYGLFRSIEAIDPGFLDWEAEGPVVAGAAIVAAGLYQLTPLKRACLRHCRTPLHFVLHGWREGRRGALRMGIGHGAWCVGCCWGLMLILFALGVMSLLWMAVVATIIFAEKVLPIGARLPRALAACFVALGIWIAVAPGSVPGLTEPGMAMSGMDRMDGTDRPASDGMGGAGEMRR
jgi:predicted metal-binding membrane protein